jgi:hypothetical protein
MARRITKFVLVAALFASSAWARLGETEEQAEQRYGKPSFTTVSPEGIKRHYLKGAFHRRPEVLSE